MNFSGFSTDIFLIFYSIKQKIPERSTNIEYSTTGSGSRRSTDGNEWRNWGHQRFSSGFCRQEIRLENRLSSMRYSNQQLFTSFAPS